MGDLSEFLKDVEEGIVDAVNFGSPVLSLEANGRAMGLTPPDLTRTGPAR